MRILPLAPLTLLTLLGPPVLAQHRTTVAYRVTVDRSDLRRIGISMRIENPPDTVRLAMAAHPEYDDRYWRYVSELTARGGDRPRPVVREDSAVWRLAGGPGPLTVRYVIALPAPESPRAAWRPFLAPTGGLVGGPHTFMYILGHESAASRVTFELPAGWEIATGLIPTREPRTFTAPAVAALIDSPALVGRFSVWRFTAGRRPHRIVYWRRPDAAPFDTVAFAGSLERVAQEALSLFGGAPYRDYTFLIQDGAYGALEHANSVTLGISSASLAQDPAADLDEAAHEYIHTWNLVYLRPAGYGAVGYRPASPSTGLWLSEGLTMYYADVLLRRGRLPTPDSTRLVHVGRVIARYLGSSGNYRLSAEQVSRAEYSSDPAVLGDYLASTHLQGELIGTMLDLVIRNATADRRSFDDVMRLLVQRFGGSRGFTTLDVERTVEEVCACAVAAFFDAHVRHGGPIDFDRYLALAGLRTRVSWSPALDRAGEPAADLRIWAADAPDAGGPVLRVFDPESAWGRAGLHTGDRLVALNGQRAPGRPEFRTVLGRARMGDTIVMDVRRGATPVRAVVIMDGYRQPTVVLDTIAGAPPAALALRARWLDAAPVRAVTGAGGGRQ